MNTGGPAFPTRNTLNDGITIRDYFAAKAMQGIMMGQYPVTKDMKAEEKISIASYQLADAMLKAREK